jgi:hypothetical protein
MNVFIYFICGLVNYAVNTTDDIVLNEYKVKQFVRITINCHPVNYKAYKKKTYFFLLMNSDLGTTQLLVTSL